MVERQCPICENSYLADPTRLAHGRQTTCSRKCSYSLRRQPDPLKTMTGPCAVCGRQVTRYKVTRKRSSATGLLCSRKCHYEARSLGIVGRRVTQPYNLSDATRASLAEKRREQNARRKAEGRYGMSEETKAKLSITTAKAIAEGRIPRVSGLEQRVEKVLHKLGINFLAQHGIRDVQGRYGAVLDFYLPDENIALEVNGTFWHSDPRAYPDGPVKHSQFRVAERYQKKLSFLTNQGVRVVEVWEMDFTADAEGSVRAALGI